MRSLLLGAFLCLAAPLPAQASAVDVGGRSLPAARSAAQVSAGCTTGVQPVVFILVDYGDTTFATQPAWWSGRLGQVIGYYTEVSYGQLTLVRAQESPASGPQDGIVGPYRLGPTHPYRTLGNQWARVGANSEAVATLALTAADQNIDFASYDANGTGTIEFHELHIVIVLSGFAETYAQVQYCNTTPGQTTVAATWAHRWGLSTTLTLDGVVVGGQANGGGYVMSAELQPSSGGCPPASGTETHGVLCHELGHDLGLPDLYDTTPLTPDSFGLGWWCLMASGLWAGTPAGSSPVHLSAWCKVDLGWITPVNAATLSNPVSLARVENHPSAVIAYAGGVGPEYFLIENRRAVLRDAALPGEGMLVYHVNDCMISARRAANLVNADETRKGVDLECADQVHAGHQIDADDLDDVTRRNAGDATDPFFHPAHSAFAAIGASSPDSRRYGGEDSGIAITRISPAGDTVAFDITTNATGAPPALSARPATIPAATGGSSTLRLRVRRALGGSLYQILGTGSGTAPGFCSNRMPIPLNLDSITMLTLVANPPMFSGFVGFLDGNGQATATLTIPALGTMPPMPLDFSAIVMDGQQPHDLDFVSNPVRITVQAP